MAAGDGENERRRFGHAERVRFDLDKWADSLEGSPGCSELLDPDTAILIVLMAGGFCAGIAALAGLPIVPAALVGAAAALLGLIALLVRAVVLFLRWRHTRARVSGDDQDGRASG
jgi:hypothetical protein